MDIEDMSTLYKKGNQPWLSNVSAPTQTTDFPLIDNNSDHVPDQRASDTSSLESDFKPWLT